ncbi:MAG: hypothetical protein LBI84_06365 [Propionibacteriaceae bacterium]|jgi:hypothetical protein|nr:hypothetical protein [Propionibacteriaceae bacterium]
MTAPSPPRRAAMRLAVIVSEAGRDLARGVTRAGCCAAALGLALAGLVAVDGLAVRRLIAQAQEFQDRGAATLIITLAGGVDGRLCDALARQPGVRAAGAVRVEADPLLFAQLPDSPVSFYSVSPGFAAMLPAATGPDGAGLLVSREVAERFGFSLGSRIDLAPSTAADNRSGWAAGTSRTAGWYDYPQDGRPPGFGYAALAPTPADQRFDQCWLDQYPVVPATSDLLYSVILPDADTETSPPQINQHNGSLGAPTDPAAAYGQRPTAWAAAAAGLVGLAVGLLAVAARRVELASNAHAGQRRLDQLAAVGLETAAWALTAAAVGAAALAGVSRGLEPADRLAVARSLAGVVWAGVAGAMAGAWAAALVIRPSKLFAYAKER